MTPTTARTFRLSCYFILKRNTLEPSGIILMEPQREGRLQLKFSILLN